MSPRNDQFQPGPGNTRKYRDALGAFATGVTVVTADARNGPVGITANSFASVSLDPPLVLWSAALSSARFPSFSEASHFSIHVLGEDQHDLCARFTRGGGGFDGLSIKRTPEGIPVIESVLARFDCALEASHPAGDHRIFVGRVLCVTHRKGAPLCFASGRFGRFLERAAGYSHA